MKLVGLMPVRSEQWVVGLSARAALIWCDELIVLDHASTDDTPGILADIATETKRLTVISEPDPIWAEMAHRQRLLEVAREHGATHCALVDADEVLTGNLVGRIKNEISSLVRPARCFMLPLFAMWRSLDWYRDDASVWSKGHVTVAFADHPMLHWKADNGYDLHHREPYSALPCPRSPRSIGGVMHLQFANWRRLRAKHALYKMTETIRWPGRATPRQVDALYNMALDERGLRTREVPRDWWIPYAHLMKYYRPDEEPWQEAACAELWAKHGPETFRGLNLFGVIPQ